jgi:hypothetical protein
MNADSISPHLEVVVPPSAVVPGSRADLEEYALGDSPRPLRRAKRMERMTRRAEAFVLHRTGIDAPTIADRMGVHPKTVQRWIREEVQRIPQETADEIRALELARLDAILAPQMRAAMAGDARAAEVVLRIMDRRARYLGLDQAKPGGFEQVGNLLDRLVFGTRD